MYCVFLNVQVVQRTRRKQGALVGRCSKPLRWPHRCSQGRSCPPNFLENIVILCIERRFSKQNSVIRLKSNILVLPKFCCPPKISGLATPLVDPTIWEVHNLENKQILHERIMKLNLFCTWALFQFVRISAVYSACNTQKRSSSTLSILTFVFVSYCVHLKILWNIPNLPQTVFPPKKIIHWANVSRILDELQTSWIIKISTKSSQKNEQSARLMQIASCFTKIYTLCPGSLLNFGRYLFINDIYVQFEMSCKSASMKFTVQMTWWSYSFAQLRKNTSRRGTCAALWSFKRYVVHWIECIGAGTE